MRRKLTLKGVKPIGQKMEGFENFYIYGLINPSDGETYFWEFNSVNKDCFNVFMEKFNEEYSDYNNIIILDNASFHKGKELYDLENTTLIFQPPPYSPEVNGAERVWKEIKDKLGWLVFETLDDLRETDP